jgi:pheromone shutdown-related protein TraB
MAELNETNKTEIEVLSNTLTKFTKNGKEVYLLGTAHISEQSVDEVSNLISELKPDTVAIELCASRFSSLKNPEQWKKMDLFTALKEGKTALLVAQLILSSFQKKLGSQLKIKPGEEMVKAAQLAEEAGAEIVLADRELRTTLRRVWYNLSWLTKGKLVSAMINSLFTQEKIKEDDIEKLKNPDMLEQALLEFTEALPEVHKPLIHERDQFLTYNIRSAPGKKILAVVGAGHCPGIREHFDQEIDIEEISRIPKTSLLNKFLNWGLPPLIVITVIFWATGGSGSFDSSLVKSYLGVWCLTCVSITCLACLVTLTHPISLILSSISSPVTTLIPFIKPGLVAGLVQAYFKKPQVKDMEQIHEDVSSLRGWLRNRVSHTLLVVLVEFNSVSIYYFLHLLN